MGRINSSVQGVILALPFLMAPVITLGQASFVEISQPPGPITLGSINFFDGLITSASTPFTVKATDVSTVYDVWVTVPSDNRDATHEVYLAKSGSDALPLSVRLTGNGVNVNPAQFNGQPNTGRRSDGDNVSGTDSETGTTYTLTMEENTNLFSTYPSVPNGSYSLPFTVHVALQ